MTSPLSKRYSKALIEALKDRNLIEAAYSSLVKISNAFAIAKFNDILTLSEVSKTVKADLIKQIAENNNEYFNRFLDLVIKENRLALCCAIAEDVRLYLTEHGGVYVGECISTFAIEQSQIDNMAKAISAKLNLKVELKQKNISKTSTFDGVMVEIRDLNVEVELNKPAISHELISSILQQIQSKSF